MTDDELPEPLLDVWTIYFNPTDAPGRYVTRVFHIMKGTKEPVPGIKAFVSDSLEVARRVIPDGMTNLGRAEDDEPQIVESWI